MTKDEILKIKEHIEIHARREHSAIIITEILWKAVDELERIEELEKENEKLKSINKKMQCCKNCKKYRMLESQVSLRCLKNRRINFCCEEWELTE